MMRIAFRTGIAAMTLTAAVLGAPLTAKTTSSDRNGSAEIINGDYSNAERTLVAERRLFPDHADLTLNLAAVYQHAGRISEARALYRDVLRRPDAQLELASQGSYSSHALATVALQRLERTQLTAR